MGQPIRNIVKEANPEATKKVSYTLLVDGQNILSISAKGDKERVNSKGEKIGGIFQFLIQMKILLKLYQFDNVYVVWDGKLSGKLRYNVYPEYKANRGKDYERELSTSDYYKELDSFVKRTLKYYKGKKAQTDLEKDCKDKFDESEDLRRQKKCVIEYLEELFVRQVWDSEKEEVEGDDLIAYYCANRKENEKIVIASGDRDLTQLIDENIAIYIPIMKKFIHIRNYREFFNISHENIALMKILCGDDSDNIKGIKGLGETTMLKIMPEMQDRKVELDEFLSRTKELSDKRVEEKKKPLQVYDNILNRVTEGCQKEKIFEINEKIINLKKPLMNESTIETLENIIDAPICPENRGLANLQKLIKRDGITDLLDDNRFVSFFAQFQEIITKEMKYYKKCLE